MAKNAAGGHKAGKKNRKHKRHLLRSPSHKAYEAEGRFNKNKLNKLRRHLKDHPRDLKNNVNEGLLKDGTKCNTPDYKIKKLTPEQQKDLEIQRNWKHFLRK